MKKAKMANNSTNLLELKSELFALITTITKMYTKYQEKTITFNYFKKAIKNALTGLLKINLLLKENRIPLYDVLNEMNYIEEYNNALDIINTVSNLNIDEDHSLKEKKILSSILELPALTSEITSSFITIMDALKIEGFTNISLILKLFQDLNTNFDKLNIPGLEEMKYKIKMINDKVLNKKESLLTNSILKEQVVDELYQIFREFQTKLHLKP